MVLQIIALVLAFSIRKVKVKGLNDAKYIAAAVYVTSIVLAVILISTYTLTEFVNGFVAVVCTGNFIGTTFILGLVFVPKVRYSNAPNCVVVRARSPGIYGSKPTESKGERLRTRSVYVAINPWQHGNCYISPSDWSIESHRQRHSTV